MTRVEQAAMATFSLQVWTRERNCVACGEPGSNAHHVLFGRHHRRTTDPRGGVTLCGSGTTGCHGLFHAGDVATRREIGLYIVEQRDDTLDFLVEELGAEGAIEYLDRVYYLAEEPARLATSPGKEE